MNENQGYFSIIQYSETPERAEFVNIGIVLFSNASPRVLVKFSNSSSRVRRVFGVYLGKHFEFLKAAMHDRIVSEFSGAWNLSQIERFISLRSGNIRLSPPKSILAKDPSSVLEDIFDRLVGGVPDKMPVQRIQTRLKREFELKGVEKLLEKPEPVSLPQGVTVKTPYAYQNGSYNMIDAISLRDDPNKVLEAASKQAIEGRWLSQIELDGGKKKLIVVGDVEDQQPNFISAIRDMMESHGVGFYTLSDIDPLADDIRKNFALN
tara:strand:+ start:1144 stop:1935 length:792 start_codon:yes stop_codon:yes gene_type:complete